ncbi:hypothetical protein NEOLEDRAFT_258539 [Neolentinus lepideus HHB14362 ss-1]|uniref:Uncharacterized protein n=1 Tax=Neolentinus lepideus HHB14362 ss-1 TaxID=1314782 RepID=A0A165M8V2_9AGAM|nr:hypothetical protein NEOLEDRAFT_258539 [Neolentinus lepideus HHB14362 ss-1]
MLISVLELTWSEDSMEGRTGLFRAQHSVILCSSSDRYSTTRYMDRSTPHEQRPPVHGSTRFPSSPRRLTRSSKFLDADLFPRPAYLFANLLATRQDDVTTDRRPARGIFLLRSDVLGRLTASLDNIEQFSTANPFFKADTHASHSTSL